LISAAAAGGSYNTFQLAKPKAQIEIRIPLHKEMEVVGHHNVPSDHNVVIVRPSAVGDDRIVDLCDIKNFSAALLRIWSQSTKGRFEKCVADAMADCDSSALSSMLLRVSCSHYW
jgi:hypothetical protein